MSAPRSPSVTAAASSGVRAVVRSSSGRCPMAIAGTATAMAHLVVYEPEAVVVQRIFEDYLAGHSTREIVRRLNFDQVLSSTGKAVWGTSTIDRVLRNETYVGRAYYNRRESIPDERFRRRTRQVLRPPEQWIAIDVPRIVSD